MADHSEIRQIVEGAVARVLAKRLPELQEELVRRVLESLPAPAPSSATPGAGAGALLQAIADIQASATQKEILKALLDGGSAHCSRIALFVVKAGAATGWQSRGFGEGDIARDFPLDMNTGPVAHAYQNRTATPANIAEMDARFVEHFGGPSNEQILIVPLLLKDKVAALVYGDGGAEGTLDGSALELLVMATSAWLELTSLRKQAHREPEAAEAGAAPVPVQTVSSFADPFAGHAPRHAARTSDAEAGAEVVEVGRASSAAAPAAAADPYAGLSAEDADTHRKAQRFARLLVDEIKLYNQAKVAEGRRHKDVYDRLKADIEKSRATYQKRYGNTAAASGEYFAQELVRSLAEDDVSVMGANFKG